MEAMGQEIPDLVLTGGQIFTGASRPRWARALAVRGDRIFAVGDDDEVRALAGPATREMRLHGRTVVPGLNDAHAHVSPAPRQDTELTLPHDPTLDEVRDALESLGGSDEHGWVVGVVGPRVLLDDRVQRDVLDTVVPRRPVWLAGYTGHGAVLNSTALRRLDLGDDRPAVAGGWYERCGDERHRGVLHEYEGWVASRRRRDGSRDDAVRAYREVATAAIRWGMTSYQQMATDRPAVDAVDMLREVRPEIRWRVVPMPMSTDDQLVLDDVMPDGAALTDLPNVTVSGRKWILDGTPVEAAAAVRAPWHGLDRAGRLNFPEPNLHRIVAHALDIDEQLILHVCGDATAAAVVEALERTGGRHTWSGRRVRIEHGDLLDHELAGRLAAFGAFVVQNPLHFDDPIVRRRLGPARASERLLLHDLPETGLGLGLGSDGPLNPWLSILAAITTPNRPDQALTREEAIAAYTHGSAAAEFAEHDKGTLEAGKLADLAVLDRDVFTVPANELPATTSLLTLVGGKIVWGQKPFARNQ